MPKRLQHTYPTWEPDDSGEGREVWAGRMHIVSPKRARVLRKRGVPLMPLHAVVLFDVLGQENGYQRARPTTPGNGPGKQSARYAWFEPTADYEARKHRRAANCYNMHLDAEAGLC